MQLFRSVFTLVFAAIFSTASFAQQHLAKTLLWRISGNGLQKPSYLFGTMHLTDKRLFNFDDSVYGAIEKTEGFAMELNPDEMVGYMINKAFDQFEKGKKVQQLLGDKDYKQLRPALEKKFGKPAEDITTSDIVKEKHKWMGEYLKKGEVPTFVDAFLYSIAKKQGKWIGGVEDMSDQASIMDDIVDKSDITYMLADDDGKTAGADNALDKMINIYSNQDIQGIEGITNAGTSAEKKDILLVKRNIKMARRIDSLAAFRTMFFAIGAAHLPGDSGVIELLKERGFTVQPVLSNKKIPYGSYKVKEVELAWTEVNDENGLYTVSMPGNAQSIKLFGLVDIKFQFDLTNLSGFYTMAGVNPAIAKNKDSIYNAIAARMFAGTKLTPKKLSKDGFEGREFEGTAENMSMRVQVYLQDKTMYMAMAYAIKKENTTSPVAEKFFKSFAMHSSSAAPATASVFSDSIMGIRFNSPARLTINPKLSPANQPGWKISAFTGTDVATGSYIMLFSKEVSAGRLITNDSIVYGEFFKALNKQYSNLTVRDTLLQGLRALQAEGKSILQANIYIKLLTTIAGNRNIVLLVICDSAHLDDAALNGVFSSFKFTPHPNVAWNQYADAATGYSTWAPSPFRIELQDYSNTPQHVAYDTATATSYFILPDTLGKYSWAENDSVFWKGRADAYKYTDSIISQTQVQNGSLNGIELLMKVTSSKNIYKRVRMLLDCNIVQQLLVTADRATLLSDNTDKFFAGFRVASPNKVSAIGGSKASLLLNDLQSSDSATRYDAFRALWNAPFTPGDLPLLHEALFKSYKNTLDSTDAITVNAWIAQALEKLGSPATIAFVKQQYNTFPKNREELNGLSLSLLAGIHTKESYDAMVGLLVQALPKKELYYRFENNLTDSLALTVTIYPQLLQFAADSIMGLPLADITMDLLDSNLVTTQTLAPAEKDFIANAKFQLQRLKLQAEDDINYNVYRLIDLLGKIKTPEAIAVLTDYLEVTNLYVRKRAVKTMLTINQPVPAATITSLAADIDLRTVFYDDLKKLEKENLFPAQYLTQQYFAESAVYSAANDNDEDEDYGKATLQFLSKKTAKYQDKTYTFYLYKVTYKGDDGEKTYLGIAGGYETAGKGVEPAEELTGLYWKEEYDAKKVTALFDAYIAQLNAGDEGDEEQ